MNALSPPMPNYDGKTNIIDFFADTEHYLITQEIPQERWVDVAAGQLEGNLAKWWRTEGRLRRDSWVWSYFKHRLMALYSLLLDEVALIKKVINRTYDGRGDVESFLLDTVQLYRRWRPQAADAKIIQCMISQMPLNM